MALPRLLRRDRKEPTDEVSVDNPEPRPKGFTLLLEDGRRIPASNSEHRKFRAQGDDNRMYDHCKDAADGEWVYRPVK